MAPARSAGNGYYARRCQRHKYARDSHRPDAIASRRHIKKYSIKNPSNSKRLCVSPLRKERANEVSEHPKSKHPQIPYIRANNILNKQS